MEIKFEIPKGMTAEEVAKRLTQILRRIRGDWPEENDGSHGPFRKKEGEDRDWQLDGTNDYFFHFHGENGNLVCRDREQEQLLQAVAEDFKERPVADKIFVSITLKGKVYEGEIDGDEGFVATLCTVLRQGNGDVVGALAYLAELGDIHHMDPMHNTSRGNRLGF